MTNRQLFHATMNRENGTSLLHMEQGFNVTYEKWLDDGLPKNVKNASTPKLTEDENLYDHMNVSGYLECKFKQFCIPAFEQKIISEENDRRTYINENGVTLRIRSDAKSGNANGSPPYEIDFSIKTKKDYLDNRYRFVGNIENRYDAKWLIANAEAYCSQPDHPVTLWVHGPFAFLREILGVENAMILPYIEPEMITCMIYDHLETSMQASLPVIHACKPDMCFIWEDCCGSSGPFIAPDIFDKFMVPWYLKWKAFLVSNNVQWIMLDTDGNPAPLAKRWYEVGVDCMQPWEVNAVDMLKFAEEFPQYIVMGGIYKHMFEPGSITQIGKFKSDNLYQAIDDELKRVVDPMIKRGGYIAALDHWAYWETTYDGYKYYSRRLEEIYNKANQVNRFKGTMGK